MNVLLFALATLAAQESQALPKIAELESASGGVQIIDPKGESRTPTKFGRRLKNADVRDEDKIKTGAGAQAVLVFPDRSRYTIKEKSEIQILQKDLPKPTEEGQTVGRRIRLLFGDLASEIVPNGQVHTDFETPVGGIAVRGTVLRMSVGAVSLKLETLDGVGRYYNAKFATTLDVGRGQAVRFVNGSLVIEVDADGGRAISGNIGTRGVRLTQGDRIIVREPRGQSPNLRVDVDTGPLDVDTRPTNESFEAPPGGGVGANDAGFDPKASTGQPLPDGISIVPDTTVRLPDSNDTADLAVTLATSESSQNSFSPNSSPLPSTPPPPLFPMIIDDFNRVNDTIIGNGWTEVGVVDWQINSNVAFGVFPFSSNGDLVKDIGFLPTWDIQADFRYSALTMLPELGLNSSGGGTGCVVQYDAVFAGGTLKIFDDGVMKAQTPGLGAVTPNTWFTMGISFNGSTFCGTLSGMGGAGPISGSACTAATSLT